MPTIARPTFVHKPNMSVSQKASLWKPCQPPWALNKRKCAFLAASTKVNFERGCRVELVTSRVLVSDYLLCMSSSAKTLQRKWFRIFIFACVFRRACKETPSNSGFVCTKLESECWREDMGNVMTKIMVVLAITATSSRILEPFWIHVLLILRILFICAECRIKKRIKLFHISKHFYWNSNIFVTSRSCTNLW